MKKVIFMDIDGTLVNENGVIPDSAREAVREARANGHLVYICTGRSKAELFEDILDVGFDGIIGAAGGYVEADGEVVFHESLEIDDVKRLVAFFDENEIDFYLESNAGLLASHNCKAHLSSIIENYIAQNPEKKEEIEKGIQPFNDSLIDGANLIRNDINKISFFGSSVPIEEINNAFGVKFSIISSTVPLFGENSGEVSLPGIHKATAIEKLLDYLKLDKKDTFAYGDGLNDLEMIEYVEHGIAMGNAKEALKKMADDVTDSHNDNGIFNSFKKYGLI